MSPQKHPNLIFKPLEDLEISEVTRRQGECPREMSEILDNKPSWAPLSASQVKEKIAEEQKKPHTTIFAIYSGKEFIGVGEWSANWDTWSPYAWFIVWPEYRRNGFGTSITGTLLEKCFLENPGHEVTTAIAEWNYDAISFINHIGFTDIGKMRRVGMLEGKYFDLLFFDMLKSEFLDRRKGARK
ncbi:MAG: GNAT family N-acetyltransferase [Candidatus Thermoplasmatota archaeon]|nr:GNAT family N-acetyltransferase [Euryarchaeota archaeon]MBU4032196.1 GNAT family N-acetyltransferase [Candidatus Thermoplasmatota archaeon]MBU4072098.1 GNAT family N-acetyltransferase [Candidatus Thermoplasmatota archaeon]MBU4143941.1 GNAT family N-acetyltransferase [Candidatus Thermoplasmatota archaeon]MBU4592548.1 GNAT family N-acetyltransferase [Candidatus Thermoplasmatota archaeon]